jgi:hypothetical protein
LSLGTVSKRLLYSRIIMRQVLLLVSQSAASAPAAATTADLEIEQCRVNKASGSRRECLGGAVSDGWGVGKSSNWHPVLHSKYIAVRTKIQDPRREQHLLQDPSAAGDGRLSLGARETRLLGVVVGLFGRVVGRNRGSSAMVALLGLSSPGFLYSQIQGGPARNRSGDRGNRWTYPGRRARRW